MSKRYINIKKCRKKSYYVEYCDEKYLKTLLNNSIMEKYKNSTKKGGVILKKFFGGIFVKKETLKEADINHPVKLEYYKIINEENGENLKFGIEIVKTDYIDEKIEVEKREIKHLSNDEEKINDILTVLKCNEVTPISVEDIILEISQQKVFSIII